MPASEIDAMMQGFNAGRIDHIVSCQMLIEGFNSARAKVGVNARRCTNTRVLHQLAGRIVRAWPGYAGARLIELGATSWVHGRIEDRYRAEWLVEQPAKRTFEISAKARGILHALDPVGESWFVHPMRDRNVYVRPLEDDAYRVVIEETATDRQRLRIACNKASAAEFLAEMGGHMEEFGFGLGARQAPASAGSGFPNALAEHVSLRCRTGAELDRCLSEAGSRSAGVREAGARPRLSSTTPKDALRDIRHFADGLSGALSRGADGMPAAIGLMESFVSLGEAIPNGACAPSLRAEFSAVSRFLESAKAAGAQAGPSPQDIGPAQVRKHLVGIHNALCHKDIKAIAEAAEMGGFRKATLRLLKEAHGAMTARTDTARSVARESAGSDRMAACEQARMVA